MSNAKKQILKNICDKKYLCYKTLKWAIHAKFKTFMFYYDLLSNMHNDFWLEILAKALKHNKVKIFELVYSNHFLNYEL